MNPGLIWEREKSSWPNHQFSRFVSAAGLRWHVQLAGSGPALLLVHGTGSSTHTWRDLFPELARDYTVIAPDLPGHGFTSPVAANRYSLGGMCNALVALLCAMRRQPVYCIGHSAGAAIVCHMALSGGVEPRRIVSINGAFLPFAGAAAAVFSPIAKLFASSATIARLIAWRARDLAAVGRVIGGTGSTLDARGLELYARLVRDPRHVAAALAMMGNWDLHSFESELGRLECPVTLIVGERDRAVPPAQARRVLSRLAHGELCSLPNLGHLAHEEAPAEVLALIRSALAPR